MCSFSRLCRNRIEGDGNSGLAGAMVRQKLGHCLGELVVFRQVGSGSGKSILRHERLFSRKDVAGM